MLAIHFEGWFQCRLATNPDPSDEPRGVSGYTFALPGEPDLDRIIRLQDPVAHRSHGPGVGVSVRSVSLGDSPIDDHPLVGAQVDLLDQPRFESRNLLLTDDEAGVGLIFPFHLRIRGGGVTIQRKDVLLPGDPDLPLHRTPPDALRRRAATILAGMLRDPLRIAEATGISDPLAFRLKRKRLLARDLETTDDPVARAALRKRINELSLENPMDMRVLSLSLIQTWQFGINGPLEIDNGTRRDGGSDHSSEALWPIAFWLGGWDADSLCGFMKGLLKIPENVCSLG